MALREKEISMPKLRQKAGGTWQGPGTGGQSGF
jgi:hypothetical protein